MKAYDDFNKVSPVRISRVPKNRRSRNPLITAAGFRNFLRLKQHECAPIWNFETGDRVEKNDLEAYDAFSDKLNASRTRREPVPPPEIIDWIKAAREQVPAFMKQIPEGFDLQRNWCELPTLNREDIAARIETLVPLNADLSRLIVYDTSGTTGHAMVVPHHPGAMAKVLAMMEFVMGRYGIMPEFSPLMTACINVGAQANTVVFPNILSVWREAGFAKINFHPDYWRNRKDAQKFITEASPLFLTGDPVGFSEMMRWKIKGMMKALFSTALTMPDALRKALEASYRCPVIDWYAITEVGPIGYRCPQKNGFHVLPHDIYVELVDEAGHSLPIGERGEIAVTGGRNPYLPLLRYRTGDWARMDFARCACGDPMPRIVDLEGRKPVLFYAREDRVVNPVDIGRLLRDVASVQHRFVQRVDQSCDLYVRPLMKNQTLDTEKIINKLKLLFGEKADLRVHIDPELGSDTPGGKVVAYESEIYPRSK